MKPHDFPEDIRPYLKPFHAGKLIYRCLGCKREFGIDRLVYVCPSCGQVLLIYDKNFSRLKDIPVDTFQGGSVEHPPMVKYSLPKDPRNVF